MPNLCRLYFNYLEAGLKIIGLFVCLENKQFWVPRYYAFKALPRVSLAPRNQNKLQWAMAMAITSSSLCNSSAAAPSLALLFTILRWWRWPTRVFCGSLILLITMVPPTYWERKNQRTTGPGYLDKMRITELLATVVVFSSTSNNHWVHERTGGLWMVIGLFKFLRGWVPDLFLENHSNEGNFAQFLIGKCPSPTKLFCFFEW